MYGVLRDLEEYQLRHGSEVEGLFEYFWCKQGVSHYILLHVFFGCTFREIREMRRKLQKHGQPSRYGKLLLWEGVFVKVPLDVGAGWMVPEEEQWDDGAMNPLAKSYGLAMIFFGDES